MSPQEKTIADVILRGITVRIALIALITLGSGIWGVSAAYYGLKTEIEVIKVELANKRDCQCSKENSVVKK